VVTARTRAALSNPASSTPDHLLLGTPDDPAAPATVLLQRRNVDVEAVRAAVAPPPSAGEPPQLIPFRGPARMVPELTFREALRLGHNYIGTEHLLLALLELEDGQGPPHRVGIDKDRAEADPIAALQALSSGESVAR